MPCLQFFNQVQDQEEIGIEPKERDSCRGVGQVIESKVPEFSLSSFTVQEEIGNISSGS